MGSGRTAPAAAELAIRTALRPGDIGAIVRLHGEIYGAEQGWDRTFEAYVAEGLGRFVLDMDDAADRIWIAERAGEVVGSVAIRSRPGNEAQLRYFILHPAARGAGLGRALLRDALAFCRARGYRAVFLFTARGLDAAAHLYLNAGFELTGETTAERWGATLIDQRYELRL